MDTNPHTIRVEALGSFHEAILFVGQAPADHEVRRGEPFVGAAGRTQDRLNLLAGITRDEATWTNLVKVRCPRDKIKFYLDLSVRGGIDHSHFMEWIHGHIVEPPPKGVNPDIKPYVLELLEEVDKFKGNVICTLGNEPLWILMGVAQIRKRRGSILNYNGKKLIPCVHPSAVIRSHSVIERFLAKQDMRVVKAEYTHSAIKLPKRALRTYPTYEEALLYIEECQKLTNVGFDIEVMKSGTGGVLREVSCLGFAKSPYDAMCIHFFSKGKNVWEELQEVEIMEYARDLLEDESITKTGQNIIFDANFMYRKYGILTRNVDDTMIAHAVRYPDLPKGLDFLTRHYTRDPYYKDEGKEWGIVGGDAEPGFFEYNARDACIPLEVFPKLMKEIDKQDKARDVENRVVYYVHRDLIYPLLYMQDRGLWVDQEGMKKEGDKLKTEVEDLKEQLSLVMGRKLSTKFATSHAQQKEYFYRELGIRPYKKDGKEKMDKEVLKRLKKRGHKEADLILEIKSRETMRTRYLEVKLSEDGRLRSSFNPVGTRSGRLSSSADIFGEGTNIQTLPWEVKIFVGADEGYLIYEFDKAQAENRIVAYIAPDANMIHAFENKMDIHRMTAAIVYDLPIEEISNEPGSGNLGDGRLSQRAIGKKANHALNYGLGVDAFSQILEVPRADAQMIKDKYFTGYPGVGVYHRWISAVLKKTRTLVNCFKRGYHFLNKIEEGRITEALYFIPQSTVADLINRWGLLEVWNKPELYAPTELLNQVHDSVIMQIPISAGVERHWEIVNNLVESLDKPLQYDNRRFVIPTDVKIGRLLGDMTEFKADDGLDYNKFKEAFDKYAVRRVSNQEISEEDRVG